MFFSNNLMKYDEVTPRKGMDTFFIVQHWPHYDDFIEMHRHEFIEITYVESGDVWHVLNDQVFRCREGDCFLINPGDSHMWLGEMNNPATIWNLILMPGLFDTALPGKKTFADATDSFLLQSFSGGALGHSLAARFSPEEIPEITRLFENLLHEYEAQEIGFEEMARSLSVELLVRLMRRVGSGDASAQKRETVRQKSLHGALEYIAQHYAESVPLETLSSLAYLSPKYFSKLFKDTIGCTVTEYIQKMRITSACRLLRETGDSVAEIARKVGYTDVKYFTRVFRGAMGIPPAQYRKFSP